MDSGMRLSYHDCLKLCQRTRETAADEVGSLSSSGLDGRSGSIHKD